MYIIILQYPIIDLLHNIIYMVQIQLYQMFLGGNQCENRETECYD